MKFYQYCCRLLELKKNVYYSESNESPFKVFLKRFLLIKFKALCISFFFPQTLAHGLKNALKSFIVIILFVKIYFVSLFVNNNEGL